MNENQKIVESMLLDKVKTGSSAEQLHAVSLLIDLWAHVAAWAEE